ncbi:hypothetical protein QO004_001166 [Rhizobium mesoamericanum]|uniref:hypothetical protein n=1 Tax=Rhizobium mesoamericanum TaxID=1079800 RepID=UPI002780AA63|nr:hypothetical protein [Rhizobium mesoamericanum]MDQ0559388.1 hypothetical protein [Rhizobium mesoamericanum]
MTEIDPARFKAKNIRMVQRLVKVWRMEWLACSSSLAAGSRVCLHHLAPRRQVMQASRRTLRSVTSIGEAIWGAVSHSPDNHIRAGQISDGHVAIFVV